MGGGFGRILNPFNLRRFDFARIGEGNIRLIRVGGDTHYRFLKRFQNNRKALRQVTGVRTVVSDSLNRESTYQDN